MVNTEEGWREGFFYSNIVFYWKWPSMHAEMCSLLFANEVVENSLVHALFQRVVTLPHLDIACCVANSVSLYIV